MKSTFRMMGIADWITLGNGLLGTVSIVFLILAFDGFSSEDGSHLSEVYIWLAMLFITLSVLGDIIDGPIARLYSKRRYLGSYLDLMSDSISFGVAPSLLVFGMFSNWGEAPLYWTISLAVACAWLVICTMLRLARFQHESDQENPWFHGLPSPGSAVFIVALSGIILLLPSVIDTQVRVNLDWIILPGCLTSGALMISDRRLPKFSKGKGLNLTLLMLGSVVASIAVQITDFNENSGSLLSFSLLTISLLLIIIHVLTGPEICKRKWDSFDS